MLLRLLSFLVFLVLQVLFLPLALVGIALITYRQIFLSRRMGVSQTAIEVLNGRYTMHFFGMRTDDAAARLVRVLPNASRLGLWLCLFPLWAKCRICGRSFLYPRVPTEGAEGMADLVPARTLYIDRIIDGAIDEMTQFVVLGAGFDTRAYGKLKRDGLATFELDQPGTQELKIASLERAGIDHAHIRFASVDFSRERAFDKLAAAGYDPEQRTVFLWEGVTLYLSEKDVRNALRGIREHSPEGSLLVADLYGEKLVRRGRKGSIGGAALAFTGERFDFGLDFSGDHVATLRSFLRTEGMEPTETFFMGANRKGGPFMVVTGIRAT